MAKEIHVYLTGRLGNQLFQYSFAKSLQKKYGGKIFLNTYDLDHRSSKLKHVPGQFFYDMRNYKLNEEVILEDVRPKWYESFDNLIARFLRKKLRKAYFSLLSKKESYFGYLMII